MFSIEEMKKKRIGVLIGGISSEREVSIRTGTAIVKALIEKGYNAFPIDVKENICSVLEKSGIDVAFIALHGKFGEDGTVQGLLELLRIPYTGSGILGSALGMNKIFSKKLFEYHGIPVPPYILLRKTEIERFRMDEIPFGFPVVVKPSCEGSTVGVNVVSIPEKLYEALDVAFSYDEEILIEKFIPGKEVTVGILDNKAIGVLEIVPKVQFYTYEAKYTPGMSEYIMPARLPSDVYEKAMELGEKAHKCLGCDYYSRVDIRIDDNMNPFVLEVNTIPGMTATSLLPKIAQYAGISFPDLVEKILLNAKLKI